MHVICEYLRIPQCENQRFDPINLGADLPPSPGGSRTVGLRLLSFRQPL